MTPPPPAPSRAAVAAAAGGVALAAAAAVVAEAVAVGPGLSSAPPDRASRALAASSARGPSGSTEGRAFRFAHARRAAPPDRRSLRSPSPQAPADSGRVVVRLITIGPGDRVWEKFGHNALWIRDPAAGRDVVYNWGIFDFQQEDFFVRLLTGRMRYRVARGPLRATLRHYRSMNRTIRVQRLRMTPEQARETARLARVHYRPENRHYAYDPFRDNCSTRIRDLLDRALDGRIREQTSGVATGTTYRSHTRRLLQRVEWAYLGIMAFLGAPVDQRLSAWDEMFLPVRMDDRLREVRVSTSSGGDAPLASAPDTLFEADRPPLPARPPDFGAGYPVAGIAGGVLLALLGLLGGRGRRAAGRGYVALGALWSAVAGAAGVVAVGGWAFTGHWYVHLNENVLQLQPLSLALAAALPLAARPGRGRAAARVLAWLAAGLAVVGGLLQPLPGLDQVNGEIVALALPLHVGLAAGLYGLRRGSGAPRAPGADSGRGAGDGDPTDGPGPA